MKAFKILISIFFILVSINTHATSISREDAVDLYDNLNLEKSLDKKVFLKAYYAYARNHGINEILTVIDYTKPSTQKRFFVIDMKNEKVLFDTYVTHGKNSGLKYSSRFSNKMNSLETSLGTFITENTYYGSNGYSLRLKGISQGLNNNAYRRNIVVHGAAYADPSVIKQIGRLGRSWGCPAVPAYLAHRIINTIKNGTVIYAYG